MNVIREPAVAGQFYPGTPAELTASVSALLADASAAGAEARDLRPPKALIVPHAGYIYSGPTAAAGYAQLLPWRDTYERVVLIGPCHRVPVRGLATSGADAFRTPLGDVALDGESIAALDLPVVDSAHRYEHSLEVHLPFLQAVLGSFTLVPIVVGNTSRRAVADVLEQVWGDSETLLVISSDLSHYLDYEHARRRDRSTCDAIEHFDAAQIDHDDACGATPVGGLLLAAQRHGLEVKTLDLRNSGDTAGDKSHVVGYGAWLFTEPR
ncbi:MAG: AmmeMemoRadiSam system protein B [Woeseiaceae bacterium]|nr:AmmeMemoRadiSam system protein B [Woeseiaceae bacterium]